jgi:hypothetical protein
MREIIFDESFSKNNITTKVTLLYIAVHELNNIPLGKIIYTAQQGSDEVQISFYFDEQNQKLDLSISFSSSYSNCLLLCGLTLTGPILDCYKANKRDRKGFMDCLKAQGHSLGTSTIACALACAM